LAANSISLHFMTVSRAVSIAIRSKTQKMPKVGESRQNDGERRKKT